MYEQAAKQLQDDVEKRNSEFRSVVNAEVGDKLQQAGISK